MPKDLKIFFEHALGEKNLPYAHIHGLMNVHRSDFLYSCLADPTAFSWRVESR